MAGVPLGSNILINIHWHTEWQGDNAITHETHPHGHLVGETLSIYRTVWQQDDNDEWVQEEVANTRRDLHIHGQVTSAPDTLLHNSFRTTTVIVPYSVVSNYQWLILAENPPSIVSSVHDILGQLAYTIDGGGGIQINVWDMTASAVEMEVIFRLLTVFVYGFVGMLTLIGLTNVISTISTNTRLRAREFAILASVGMTQGGIGKMLALESLLCSIRALVFGLPLGALAAWGVYYGTQMDMVRFEFVFPWQALVACIIGVFVLTFVTTLFSASRLRRRNVIETIRAEMG